MTLLLTILGGAFAFTRWNPGLEEDFLAFYKLLATVAVCLLIVPLFSLGASTARLSARTREDRLCTLSLLGMKPAQVRLQTIGEALLYALVGTVLGWVLNFVTVIPFSVLTFQDVPLGYRNMLLPFPYQCAVVMGLLLLALLSSLVGMGKLTITPLEICSRASLPPQGKLAAGIGILVLLVALAISVGGSLGMAGASMVLILLFALGPLVLGLIALDLVGGFLLSIYAKVRVAHVRTPEQLLGYRGLQESARTIWRQISGVAFTTFIGVILGIGMSMSGNASETLPREEILLGHDIRTGVVLTLAICFILVALSAALNQVSHIYERAVLFSSLQMMGVPAQTLQKYCLCASPPALRRRTAQRTGGTRHTRRTHHSYRWRAPPGLPLPPRHRNHSHPHRRKTHHRHITALPVHSPQVSAVTDLCRYRRRNQRI